MVRKIKFALPEELTKLWICEIDIPDEERLDINNLEEVAEYIIDHPEKIDFLTFTEWDETFYWDGLKVTDEG